MFNNALIINDLKNMKINNHLLKINIAIGLILWLTVLNKSFAQRPQIEEVTIIGSYTPHISDANKILRNPMLKDTSIVLKPIEYQIISRPLHLSFPLYTIDAQKVQAESDVKYLKNYLRLGMGSLINPYADVYAHIPQSKRTSFGIHYRHHSAQADIKDYGESSFSDNLAEIYGKTVGKTLAWSGGINYQRNMLHWYGFNPLKYSLPENSDTSITKQIYTRLRGSIGLKKNTSNHDPFYYDSRLDALWMEDKYGTSELNLSYFGNFQYTNSILSAKSNDKIGIALEANFWNNQWDLYADDRTGLISFHPYFSTQIDEYELYAGLNTSIIVDSGDTKVYVFPELRGGLTIIKDILKAYVGIKGDITRNNLNQFSTTNPFISTYVPFNFRKNSLEFYGGLSSNLGRYIGLNASISTSNFTNQAFFINDTSVPLYNQFTAIYDSGSVLKVNAEISFHKQENIIFNLGINYSSYSLENQLKPWHIPEFMVYANGRFVFGKKFIFKPIIYFQSKTYAKIFENQNGTWIEPEPYEIDPFLDLSVGLEYRISPQFSAFADFNNITGGNYQRWYNYPVHGFNVMAGITYSF